jgi:hypothetical protein
MSEKTRKRNNYHSLHGVEFWTSAHGIKRPAFLFFSHFLMINKESIIFCIARGDGGVGKMVNERKSLLLSLLFCFSCIGIGSFFLVWDFWLAGEYGDLPGMGIWTLGLGLWNWNFGAG